MTQDLIFHEIYNTYYLAAEKLIRAACSGELDEDRAVELIRETAFSESFLYILDAVKTEQWRIIDSGFQTPIHSLPKRPITNLERRWLAAVKLDPRMRVFEAEKEATASLQESGPENGAVQEPGIEPLYRGEDFVVVDRLGEGDPYEDERYRRIFQTILRGLREKQSLFLRYLSGKGKESRERYVPIKLEYSEKDDRFRLMARGRRGFTILNLARIKECALCGPEELARDVVQSGMSAGVGCTNTVGTRKARSRRIKSRVHTFSEPQKKKAVLELTDERNALERCMLHFADLEKVTTRLSERRYRVELLYRGDDETEILIRTLSFGPLLQAVSPPEFVELVVELLLRQMQMGPRCEPQDSPPAVRGSI